MLPYDRVTYDGGTGALQAWVQVPSIQQSMDTLIYMEYGNPDAADQQNRGATWPPNVVGVWHLEDGNDSTQNANHAQSVNGAMIGTNGIVGTGARFDGFDDRLLMAGSDSLDAVAMQGTISAWLRFDDASAATRQFIMASSNNITPPKSSFEWAQGTTGDNYFYPHRGDGDLAYNLITNPFTDGQWHHAAVRLNFANKAVEFFVDGMQTTLTTNNVSTMWDTPANPDDWLWGSHPLYTAPFAGSMDELRVSTGLRGSGWLATEYLNQLDPTAFIRVDPEELLP
jgi:biopolymer transport protein ExbB